MREDIFHGSLLGWQITERAESLPKEEEENIENGDDDDDDDYEEKNGLSRSDGEGFEGSSETDDGESTIGKNGMTNDDSLSRAPANANENGGERILVE